MGVEKRANLERLLRSAWERQHRPSVPKEKSSTPKKVHRPELLDYIIVRMSVPLTVVALGITLMTVNLFWSGVVTLSAGLVLLALDLAYETFLLGWPRPVQIILGIVYLAAILIVSQKWIFRAAPFGVFASSGVPIYGPGSNVNGIDWRPYLSDLNFSIKNPSPLDYDNFDAEVSTNLVMTGLQKVRALSACNVAGTHQGIQVHNQRIVGGQPVGPVDDSGSEYQVIPMDKDGKPLLPVSGGDWSYRIRCDKLPANSEFDFFSALEVVNEPNSHSPVGSRLFGDPQAASWISITARFQTSGRNREETISRCPMTSYCEAGGITRK
jgi:hypothetical protein